MVKSIKFTVAIAIVLTCSSASSELKSDITETLTLDARAKTASFAKMLKQALMEAVQSGGLDNGVNVCKDLAPEIAAQLSTDGWQVMRTSLKTRNSENAPDSWEYEMLVAFDQQFKAGQPVASLTATTQSDREYRYMQAIPTGQMCLACHGQGIEPELYDSIKQAYPNDDAIGFTLNDIRGAFTVTKSLNE